MTYVQIRRPVAALYRGPGVPLNQRPGMGLFTMASYSVWTADERSDQLNRFFEAVQSTDRDVQSHHNPIINAGAAGTRFWTDWSTFLREYNSFQNRVNAAGSWGISTGSDAILTELRGFVDRYNALDARFRAISGVAATTTALDSRSEGFSLPGSSVLGTGGSIGVMLLVGAGVIGLVALAVVATQARGIARAVTGNRRRTYRRLR